MLEVYALHVRQLAAEENHVKVNKTQGTSTVEFEKNRKEVERVIEALWSQGRPFDHGNDVPLKLGGVWSNQYFTSQMTKLGNAEDFRDLQLENPIRIFYKISYIGVDFLS